MARVVVLQSDYLPWKGYFDLIHDADVFVFYDEVKYTKNDWRNRNRVCSRNGVHWITIPVAQDAVKQKISDVELPANGWEGRHFKTLYFTYKRAPHFAQLESLLEAFFRRPRWTHLSLLNQALIRELCAQLGIRTRLLDSTGFRLDGDRVTRLLGLLEQLGASTYISGPSGREYLEPVRAAFEARGIRITYKDYSGYPEYPQLSRPFTHGVSIVDMIANLPLAEIPHHIWGFRGGA